MSETTSNDRALFTLRRTTATAVELEAALAGIDLTAADAAVEELESERRRLLAGSGSDQAIDLIEEKIRGANRLVERLTAARDELPGRIAARKAREVAVAKRRAAAEELTQRAMVLFVEIDKLAVRLAPHLQELGRIESEIKACNYDVEDLGNHDRRVQTPLQKLAGYLKCSPSELPDVARWELPGYAPTQPSDRQLGAARDLVDGSASTKKAA